MKNAVIYARYSSYNQTEMSIEGQISDVERYAASHDLKIVDTYIDRAKSGTGAEHRTEFLRMIDDSASGNFQTVIVWKMDRFSRNRYDFAIYKSKLKKNGVSVVSVNEPIADDPSGILLDSLIEGMAEYYSENLSQNVKRGLRVARQHGTFTGGRLPFGYRTDGKNVVADETESRGIRMAFRMYADGESMKNVVDELNRQGYRPRVGSRFTVNSLQNAFANRKYIGEYEFQGEKYDIYPRLIDDETFERVQTRRAAVRHAPAAGKAPIPYLLQGKAFCGHCGAPLVGDSGTGKNGTTYRYYSCAAKKKNHTCKKRTESADVLEEQIVTQTVSYIRDPETLERIVTGLKREYEKAFPAGEIQTLENAVFKLDREIENALNLLISGALSAATVAALNEKITALTAQKDDAEHDLIIAKSRAGTQPTEKDCRDLILGFCDGDVADPEYRKQVIRFFVNAVYVYDDKFLIYYSTDEKSPQVTFEEASADVGSISDVSDFAGIAPPQSMKSEPVIKSFTVFGFLFSKLRR